MEKWILGILAKIESLVRSLQSKLNAQLRIAFVCYRDWSDEPHRIKFYDFTDDINVVVGILQQLKKECFGGADTCEDVLGGLATAVNLDDANNLSWQSITRVIYHVCDEPPHGTQYHSFFDKVNEKERELKQYLFAKRGVCKKYWGNESAEYNAIFQFKPNTKNRINNLKAFVQSLKNDYDRWPEGHPKDPPFQRIFDKMKQLSIQYYISKNIDFDNENKIEHLDKMINVFQNYAKYIQFDSYFHSNDITNIEDLIQTVEIAISNAIQLSRRAELSQIKKPKPSEYDSKQQQEQKTSENGNKRTVPVALVSEHKFKVAVAIDFGTDGTGISFCDLRSDDFLKYTNVNWDNDAQNTARQRNLKKKTCILINSKTGKYISFGDVANDQYLDNIKTFDYSGMAAISDESVMALKQNNEENQLFFEHFKMALYKDKLIDDSKLTLEGDGKEQNENILEKYRKRRKKSNENNNENNGNDSVNLHIKEEIQSKSGTMYPSKKVLVQAFSFIKDKMVGTGTVAAADDTDATDLKKDKKSKPSLDSVKKNNDNNSIGMIDRTLHVSDINDIQWVVTVPAIWSDYSKNLMQQCAIEAGMINPKISDHLKIVYEPECAALSVQYEMQEFNEQLRIEFKQKMEEKYELKAEKQRMKKEKIKKLEKVKEIEIAKLNELKNNAMNENDLAGIEIEKYKIEQELQEIESNLNELNNKSNKQIDNAVKQEQKQAQQAQQGPRQGQQPPQAYLATNGMFTAPDDGGEMKRDLIDEIWSDSDSFSIISEDEGDSDRSDTLISLSNNENNSNSGQNGKNINENEGINSNKHEKQVSNVSNESPPPAYVINAENEAKNGQNNDKNEEKERIAKFVDNERVKLESKLQFKVGEQYLLCDLGGGTADFACHRIKSKHKVEDIYYPTGGPWGSSYIDKEFIKFMELVFVADARKVLKVKIDTFMATNGKDLDEIERNKEIKRMKKHCKEIIRARKLWMQDFKNMNEVGYYRLERAFSNSKCSLYTGMTDSEIDNIIYLIDNDILTYDRKKEYHGVTIPTEFSEFINERLRDEYESEMDQNISENDGNNNENNENNDENSESDESESDESDESDDEYDGPMFEDVLNSFILTLRDTIYTGEETSYQNMLIMEDDTLRIHLKIWHELFLDLIVNKIIKHVQWLLDSTKTTKINHDSNNDSNIDDGNEIKDDSKDENKDEINENNSNKNDNNNGDLNMEDSVVMVDKESILSFQYICFVGGFSACKYLQRRFNQHFGRKSEYNIPLIYPTYPALSVLDGALRYAFNPISGNFRPNFIDSRRIKRTYGICVRETLEQFKQRHEKKFSMLALATAQNNDENEEKMEQLPETGQAPLNENNNNNNNKVNREVMKRYSELLDDNLGKYVTYDDNLQLEFVDDVFHAFVRKGDKVKVNEVITEYVEPVDRETNIIYIDLYASDEMDPIFVKGNPLAFKEFELPKSWMKNNNNSRNIPIEFMFGDTQIHVKVGIEGIPENEREIKLDFDINDSNNDEIVSDDVDIVNSNVKNNDNDTNKSDVARNRGQIGKKRVKYAIESLID